MATWIVVGGIIALLVVIRLSQAGIPIFRKSWSSTKKLAALLASAQGKPAAGTTSATKTDPSDLGKGVWKVVKWVLLLAIIGWSWYSIENEVGFPGTYVANKSYEHTLPLVIKNLKDQKLCGIEPGKWRFKFPNQIPLEQADRHRKMDRAGFFIREPDGDIQQLSVISNVMINNTYSGKEKVRVDNDGCVTVSVFTSPEGKEQAEVLGAGVVLNGRYLPPSRESVPAPFVTQIQFY